MDKSSLSRLLAVSFIWNLSGNLISKGSVFVVSVITARLLGDEDFGRVALIQQTIAVFVVFATMGLSVTSIKFVAEAVKDGRLAVQSVMSKIMTAALILSSIVLAVCLYSANFISLFFFNELELVLSIKLASVVIVFSTINQVQFGMLSGLNRFDLLAKSNIISGLINIPITIFLVNQFGLNGFVLSLFSVALILAFINRVFINSVVKRIEHKHTWQAIDYKKIYKFAGPNVLSAIVFSVATWYGFSLLTQINLIEVAAFNVSNQLFGVIFVIPTMLAQVLMSFVAKDKSNRNFYLLKSVKINVIITFSCCFPLMFFAGDIMGIYGETYREYEVLLVLTLLSVVAVGLSSQFEHYFVGIGRLSLHLKYTVLYAAVFVSLSIILVHKGAIGIAIARFTAYCCKLLISIVYYRVHYAKK
jgi:O-antigen/teichoic acid export membrane protein